MNFLEVIGRNQVSTIPLTVNGEITVGCFLNGSQIYDHNNEELISYNLEVSDEMGTWLSWEVKEIVKLWHGHNGDYITLVVAPQHDSSSHCFERREIWQQEGINKILPCGHVHGWCTCNE